MFSSPPQYPVPKLTSYKKDRRPVIAFTYSIERTRKAIFVLIQLLEKRCHFTSLARKFNSCF